MSEVAVLTLTGFLLARLDEDEAVAREAQVTGDGWWHDGDGEVWSHEQLVAHPTMVAHAEHVARNDPARVLAEVAAKRAIVDEARMRAGDSFATPEHEGMRWSVTAYREVVCRLAAVYADHPDYRDEWKP